MSAFSVNHHRKIPLNIYSSDAVFKYIAPAIILEWLLLGHLLRDGASNTDFFLCLILHGLSSYFLALAIRIYLLKPGEPQRWPTAYLFIFNFAMPLIGLATVVAAYAIARRYPAAAEDDVFDCVKEPEFLPHRNREGTGFRGGQVRAHLLNSRTPPMQKMAALLSIQNIPARVSKELLRELLADSSDDIRLFAYGILDSKEKQIMQRIITLQNRLTLVQNERFKYRLHHHLAELYWELIYQNLVQGDMGKYCAEQVRNYAGKALVQSRDESLWFLLARLELASGELNAANYYLGQAQEGGFPIARLLPYLAELHFLQKRYDILRTDLIRLSFIGIPTMLPALHYWLDLRPNMRKRSYPFKTVDSDSAVRLVSFIPQAVDMAAAAEPARRTVS